MARSLRSNSSQRCSIGSRSGQVYLTAQKMAANSKTGLSQDVAAHIAEFLISLGQRIAGPVSDDDVDSILYQIENVVSLLGKCADRSSFGNLDNVLEKLQEAYELLASTRDTTSHGYKALVLKQTGEKGRPAFNITMDQLEYLLELDFTVPEISRLLHVSLSTVKRRLKEYGLSVKQTYSQISAEDLRKVVSDFIQRCPNSGYAMVFGYLKSTGIKVTQSTVRETLKAVDPVGTLLRGLHLNFVQRTVYSVPSPLSLWHIDGNHRLIKWRIVIHGGIDGFSRKIMYLKASTNNQAAAVLEAFLEAVEQFGLPSRVRSDKGGENVDVARFMLEHPLREPEKTSYITGRSVHNQRIERLWRDVWCAVTSNYYAAFQYLQDIGALDPDNEKHLICLHYVMVPRLNMDLDLFRQVWDRHPLSSEGNKSPQQLWVSGQLLNTDAPADPMDFTNFGVDWDGPVPAMDCGVVAVPEAPASLQEVVLEEVTHHIHPLMSSQCFGLDLYFEALRLSEMVTI
ncbi:uncharacterized protein LOC127639797 isoform X2 [Xyrauchen texanus]|uniref:uncharacterized protein LOC127639797 isoform X2 n=1 Tax=Xyrauchen texanus TaxID=154827 RepID=UPI0022419F9C|nr:uncharacterized protein LOC127639797 isoform X2 [Xyrauchen texanus]